MATVVWPSADGGSIRPFGYFIEATVSGTGAVYIGVPTDVHYIGYQVDTVTTGYFLRASDNSIDDISDDKGVFFDVLGNNVDEQTVAKQGSIDGTPKCIKLEGSAVGAAATIHLTFRRV